MYSALPYVPVGRKSAVPSQVMFLYLRKDLLVLVVWLFPPKGKVAADTTCLVRYRHVASIGISFARSHQSYLSSREPLPMNNQIEELPTTSLQAH